MASKSTDPKDKVMFVLPQDIEALKKTDLSDDMKQIIKNVESVAKDELASLKHEEVIDNSFWRNFWLGKWD